MKLISWNVNGIRSIYSKGFASFVKHFSPDILCLQETKICTKQASEELSIPNEYEVFFCSAEKKGYSGTATFVHNSVKHNHKKLSRIIGIDRFDTEGRFVITHHPSFLLYNVYIPSGTSGEERQEFKYDFLDGFLCHLNNLPKVQKDKLIICGDFNICHKPIDIHHPKEAEKKQLSGFLPDERLWMDKFTESGFIDTFRLINGNDLQLFTWWSYRANSRNKNLGWRIDYFFVSKPLTKKVKNAGILSDIKGSDHCPIFLEMNF